MNSVAPSTRYIDSWLYLVAPENKEICLTPAEIITGDHEPTIMEGYAKIDISIPERIIYHFEGKPADPFYAAKELSRVRSERYDARNLFRILGKDAKGREWNLGWTKPNSYEEKDGTWIVRGQCDSILGGGIEGAPSFTGAEVMFLVPPELCLDRLMTTFHHAGEGLAEFGHIITVNGSDISFRYQPSNNRLFVEAKATEILTHPFLAEALGEPLRILFGQLLYPRLVTKTYVDGHSQVHIRHTHGFIPDACFAALWPYGQLNPDRNKFWQLYGQLFAIAGNEGPKQQIFAAHTITRLYEEVIQAALGTRWVWALTLASACEALASRLQHIVPPAQPTLLKEIEEISAHLGQGPKNEWLHSIVNGALRRVVEVTTAKILRELQHQGRVKKEDVKAWNSIRNHVMHGNLVLPWSDKDEDGKIIALASLFHSLTREVALPIIT